MGSVDSSQSLAYTASILLQDIMYTRIAWNYNFDFDLRHLCVALLNYLRSELFQMHSSQAATSLDTLLQHHDHFLYITSYPISLLRLMSSFRRPIGGYLCLLAAVVPSPPEVKWLLPGRSVGAIVEAASVRKGTVWSARGATFPHQTALYNWLTGRLNELTQRPTIYWLTSGLHDTAGKSLFWEANSRSSTEAYNILWDVKFHYLAHSALNVQVRPLAVIQWHIKINVLGMWRHIYMASCVRWLESSHKTARNFKSCSK